MWLLNTVNFELENFASDATPPYAILSHTWGAEEVSFVKILKKKDSALGKARYDKVKACCQRAWEQNLRYVWIDTCCTIQTHHRGQCPTEGVAYAAEDGGGMSIAFKYNLVIFPYLVTFHGRILVHPVVRSRIFQCGTK